jgi:hypothetical protein
LATNQPPTPSNTSTKKDKSGERKPHPVPGKKDLAGKMLANLLGKKNCLNCAGDDHWVVNCPYLLVPQRNELAGMAHIMAGKDHLKLAGVTPHADCNAGKNFATKKANKKTSSTYGSSEEPIWDLAI